MICLLASSLYASQKIPSSAVATALKNILPSGASAALLHEAQCDKCQKTFQTKMATEDKVLCETCYQEKI